MSRKITALTIANLKAGTARREVPLGEGLYCIVQPSGKKSFALRYRRPDSGLPAKLTIGNGGTTLAQAKAAAADARLEIEQGRDPGKAKEAARMQAALAKTDTLASITAEYLKREGSKLRTLRQRESVFRRQIFPAL